MAKILALILVLFVAIALDRRIVPMVYGVIDECRVDIDLNCTPNKNELCKPACLKYAGGPGIQAATCMLRSDGTTFCECTWFC
ncbi:hypothetical protein P3S68_029058 [Capsicum galapagoense]